MVGPSGSGKSTWLAVIGGIERPTAGTVRIDGYELGDLDEDELVLARGQRIGILFQAFHPIPTMTALENVAVPLELAAPAMPSIRPRTGSPSWAWRIARLTIPASCPAASSNAALARR